MNTEVNQVLRDLFLQESFGLEAGAVVLCLSRVAVGGCPGVVIRGGAQPLLHYI